MTASLIKAMRNCALGLAAFVGAMFAFATPASAQSLIRDAEIEGTLRDWMTPIWVAAGLQPSNIHIYIVNDNSINAFVAGGQNIFVHTGLLMAAQDPNEIIGVLAHETGHIAGGHLARSREAQQQALGPMLISIGLGVLAMAAGAPDAGAALIAGSQGFAMGNYVRFTQVQESSADQAAASYLEATGQSGKGLIDFFDRALRPYEFMTRRAPPYMITHPFTSDRVESLRQRVESAPHYSATDTPDNVHRFDMMRAKLIGFIRTEPQTLSRYPTTDTSEPARYARAVAYYRSVDLPNAARELDSLLADEPNNAYFLELKGQILFENGHAQEAIAYHRRSLAAAPNQVLLQINLARDLNATHTRENTAEAVRLLQAAVDAEPDNAFAWRELAQSRDFQGDEGLAELASAEENFALGDYPSALNFAERARRTLPPNTPSSLRASDIVTFASDQVREQQQRHQGGRRS
jgi:predicted Zn-dependent protease